MALPPVYNIWLRATDIKGGLPVGLFRQALITDYVKLEYKLRYNNVGGWTLLMQDGTDQARAMRQIFIGSSSDPIGATSSGLGYGGIVVTRNGDVIFSGPVRGFTATGDENDGPMIEFHGPDDTAYLADRLAMVLAPIGSGLQNFQAPSNQGWASWTFPVPGGPLRTTDQVLFNLVTNNIGPGAPVYRRIPFLVIPQPPVIGPFTIVRTRFQNLLEKCQELATYIQFDPSADDYDPTYHGLQFNIHQTSDDMLLFEYRAPNDLTNQVVFNVGDPNLHTGGNIGTYEYKLDGPIINYSVIAGQNDESDDATTRWFAHRAQQFIPYTSSIKSPSTLVFGLREGFLDRRDIQYANPMIIAPGPPPVGNADYMNMIAEFTRAMDGQLREQGEITDLKITAINVSPTEFFVNYNLGDLVTVRIEGQNIQAQVMDVTVTLTKDEGEVVQPTIGTQVIGSTTRLFNQIYQTQKDISGLNTGF